MLHISHQYQRFYSSYIFSPFLKYAPLLYIFPLILRGIVNTGIHSVLRPELYAWDSFLRHHEMVAVDRATIASCSPPCCRPCSPLASSDHAASRVNSFRSTPPIDCPCSAACCHVTFLRERFRSTASAATQIGSERSICATWRSLNHPQANSYIGIEWGSTLSSCGRKNRLPRQPRKAPLWTSLRQGILALQFLSSLHHHQIFEDCPIIHMIIIEALAHEEITEDFA